MSDAETPQSPAEPLTLEQLAGIDNPETEKKVAQSLQAKVGTYNSVPELALTLGRAKEGGRQYARFFGAFTGTPDGESEAITPRLGFAVSWEARFKDSGRADNMTKMWNDAKVTYRRAMGMERDTPVDRKDVIVFLQKYSVGVRFIQGDTDNIGVAITTPKE